MKKNTLILTVVLLVVLVLASSTTGLAEKDLPSLQEIYQDYFHIGAAVSVASWAPKTLVTHREIILNQLNSVTAENAMKPEYLQREEGVFNFREADNMIDFAVEHGMLVRGHTLVWHAQTEDWFFRDKNGQLIYEKDEITEADRQLVIDRMETHIETVMTHFKDSIFCWDVVNEAVSDDGNYIHRPDSPWVQVLGDDFIKIAFRKAREVDPDAKLFYNDYNAISSYKRDRIVTMLKDMIADGVPIDGMGIQGHWNVDEPSISEIESGLKLYIDLGLEIHITELDIGIGGFTEAEQAERYREIFQLFKKYSDSITNVTLWGVADDTSWRGDANPLLFNRDHEPKPAFWALVDTDKPWHVNKAEYTGAMVVKNSNGEELSALKQGDYKLTDLDFKLADVADLEIVRGYVATFYQSADFQGEQWHFSNLSEFDDQVITNKAQSLRIRYLEPENIALNKPVDANYQLNRAGRAVDGDPLTNWTVKETPPYWLSVDLEGTYLLNRWICKLQGTGPLSKAAQSAFNAADFKLEVSSDGINWIEADSVEGNTASVTDRDLNLVEARYVRFYVTRPSSIDQIQNLVVYEFELYGLPLTD